MTAGLRASRSICEPVRMPSLTELHRFLRCADVILIKGKGYRVPGHQPVDGETAAQASAATARAAGI